MGKFSKNRNEIIDALHRLARCYTSSPSAQQNLVDLTLGKSADILLSSPGSSPQAVLFRLMHQLAQGEIESANFENVRYIRPWLENSDVPVVMGNCEQTAPKLTEKAAHTSTSPVV